MQILNQRTNFFNSSCWGCC